ncbi:peptidoglycan-binding domain-containing protein [Ruania rhizosphaerae]|uniref:peptidoglycan-binding domain-containing protein n=1 Tax=Ruania rhizosphaerae TaxID=1840413 RepID=UPI00135BB932|nr:peptidoglycan-binding domain-containing protein [Ruania rhizosphaerae]
MSRRGSKITLVGMCALTLAGTAGIVGYALRPAESPELLTPAAAETSAPVVSQPFDDTHRVQVRLVTSEIEPLVLQQAGTLTASSCEGGGSIASGTLIARVDDRPVIALHTAVPLYRDLAWGDEGTDVDALQSELARLGYLSGDLVDGYYGWNTSHAVQQLRVAVGGTNGENITQRAEFVWLPAPDVTGLACEARVGQDVSPGAALANAEGALERLEIETVPDALTPGARTLTVNGVTGPVSETGVVDDPETLAQIAADTELIAAMRAEPGTTVTGNLALAEQIDAYTVPVGAIVDDGDQQCVQADETTHLVDLLGSALGSAVISFPDTDARAPETVTIGTALTETRCDD